MRSILSYCVLSVVWILGVIGPSSAQSLTPYGTAKTVATSYAPTKVIYDVFNGDIEDVTNIFDRVSMLQNLYQGDSFDASIVVVIHGDAIPVFATKNTQRYSALMERAAGLIRGEVIEFRMCGASARMRGLESKDIHGFVTMVPMADAEIIRLQQDGYAYMQ